MERLCSADRSYYRPHGFYMWLRPGVLDGANKTLIAPGTFVHEYSHLLQDLATIYGVVDFIGFLDSMSDFRRLLAPGPLSHRLADDPRRTGLWLDTLERVGAVANPHKIWKPGAMWAYEAHRIEQLAIGDYRLPQALVRFVDNVSNEVYEHPVGPWELKEAYSVAAQTLYGDPLPSDPSAIGFEYLAVERVLQSLGAISPEHGVAICHWALQYVFPGPRLFELVGHLSAESSLPSPSRTYDLCRDYARSRGFLTTVSQCESQLQLHIDNVHQTATTDDDPLYRALCWYRDTAIPLLRWSETSRFPLDTPLCTPTPGLTSGLESLLQLCPIPMIEDPTGVFTLASHDLPAQAVFLIRSLGHLMQELGGSKTLRWECPYYAHCILPLRDDDCRSVPWTKARQKPVCDYGAAAKYLDVRIAGT